MSYYPDLSNVCDVDSGPQVRAVGWLGRRRGFLGFFRKAHPFARGEVDPNFVATLRQHIANPWQSLCCLGFHECEFCRRKPACGGNNVWIPAQSVRYVAPELIVHYIEFHNYLPPEEFIEAVMECPPQGSPEFFRLLATSGKRVAPKHGNLNTDKLLSEDTPSSVT